MFYPDHIFVSEIEELKLKLNQLMQENDIYWKRAKQFWLKDGDPNTKFFEYTTTNMKKWKRIQKMIDNTWVEFIDPQNLGRIAFEYFDQIFSSGKESYEAVISQIEQKSQVMKTPFCCHHSPWMIFERIYFKWTHINHWDRMDITLFSSKNVGISWVKTYFSNVNNGCIKKPFQPCSMKYQHLYSKVC